MHVAKGAGRSNLAIKIETGCITMDEARTELGDLTTPCTDTARAAEQLFPAYTTFSRWLREGFKVRVSTVVLLYFFPGGGGGGVLLGPTKRGRRPGRKVPSGCSVRSARSRAPAGIEGASESLARVVSGWVTWLCWYKVGW